MPLLDRFQELALATHGDPTASQSELDEAERILAGQVDVEDLGEAELVLFVYFKRRLQGLPDDEETCPYTAADLADAFESFAFHKRAIANELAAGRAIPKKQLFGCRRCEQWEIADEDSENEITEEKSTEAA